MHEINKSTLVYEMNEMKTLVYEMNKMKVTRQICNTLDVINSFIFTFLESIHKRNLQFQVIENMSV